MLLIGNKCKVIKPFPDADGNDINVGTILEIDSFGPAGEYGPFIKFKEIPEIYSIRLYEKNYIKTKNLTIKQIKNFFTQEQINFGRKI